MPSPNRAALEAIADEMRALPGRGDSPAERLESAGRLLIEAIKAGAFAEPQYAAFRAMVRQRQEQPEVNGFISAWGEAVWWLKGRPEEPVDFESDLAGDVKLVIVRMFERPKSRNRPGRPRDTDARQDQQISEAWKAGGFRSFDEFVGTDVGRKFGLTARELKNAHERHRKRESRELQS
ncbi:MAG: hypothetical protein GY842_09070 [bacterium]|nr:hypothetical protein [bacterium]